MTEFAVEAVSTSHQSRDRNQCFYRQNLGGQTMCHQYKQRPLRRLSSKDKEIHKPLMHVKDGWTSGRRARSVGVLGNLNAGRERLPQVGSRSKRIGALGQPSLLRPPA